MSTYAFAANGHVAELSTSATHGTQAPPIPPRPHKAVALPSDDPGALPNCYQHDTRAAIGYSSGGIPWCFECARRWGL